MSAPIKYKHVSTWEPDGLDDPGITISGDLRAPGSGMDDDANYEARDQLCGAFPKIDFDPESSCFYAYATTGEEAEAFAKAVDAWVDKRRGDTLPPALDPIEHNIYSDGYPSMRVRDKAEIAASLDDWEVLARIPKVRLLMVHIVSFTETGMTTTSGNDWDDEAVMDMYQLLRTTLEATA